MWMQERCNWQSAKNKFLLLIVYTIKENDFLSSTPGHKSKYLQSYNRNAIKKKRKEKQRKFEDKMASENCKCADTTFLHSHDGKIIAGSMKLP